MPPTRVSQILNEKKLHEENENKLQLMFFCVKNVRPSSHVADDEVICLETKKTKEKVGRPRKYNKIKNSELYINELHDFNDILKVNQWYSEYYTRYYQEIAVPLNSRKRVNFYKKGET